MDARRDPGAAGGREPVRAGRRGTPGDAVAADAAPARYDRVVKRPALQAAGVEEFWIVDLDARLVERWRPEDARPEILLERLTWKPDGASAGLAIDLVAFFAGVLD